MRYTELAERTRPHNYERHPHSKLPDASHRRQAFHRPHTSLGAAGHILHMGMVAAPLVIGEYVIDNEKKWKAMRMVPIAGAIASEALWTLKIAHDRQREEQDHAALDDCRESPCR